MGLLPDLEKHNMSLEDFFAKNSRLIKIAAANGDQDTNKQLIESLAESFGLNPQEAQELILQTIATKMNIDDKTLDRELGKDSA